MAPASTVARGGERKALAYIRTFGVKQFDREQNRDPTDGMWELHREEFLVSLTTLRTDTSE